MDRHRDPEWRTVWSPYQKLAVRPHVVTEGTNSVMQGYELTVNDAGFQILLNLSEPFLRSHPEVFDRRDAQRSYYNLPFAFQHDIRRLLIVGTGTGNNAAAALRHGVEQIDCVEIDPRIYALGSNLIGTLVGGLLESLSFVTGIRALVILVGLFYLIAILRRPGAVRR